MPCLPPMGLDMGEGRVSLLGVTTSLPSLVWGTLWTRGGVESSRVLKSHTQGPLPNSSTFSSYTHIPHPRSCSLWACSLGFPTAHVLQVCPVHCWERSEESHVGNVIKVFFPPFSYAQGYEIHLTISISGDP